MKNTLAGVAVVTSVSQFLCIFCCLIPTATGIIALLTSLGLTTSEAGWFFLGDVARALHPWQSTILFASLGLISMSWGIWFYGKKRAAALPATSECGCKKAETKKPIFLIVATVLLSFNIAYTQFIH